ncbi:MAG: bestrophin family ion channel [Myxococcota bacterium]|nr:bestrophin family ion channel [Myxococcota bacterium]
MIVSHSVRARHVFHHAWRGMTFFLVLSLTVWILHRELDIKRMVIPFNAIATLSVALSIYLGFKNNQAYDRWWEARKIWGLIVNYSRGFAREVLILPEGEDREGIRAWQRAMIYRHAGFVHGLRVFLRKPNGFVARQGEPRWDENTYDDLRDFLSPEELAAVRDADNPPNQILLRQGEELRRAKERGWLSDYRFVQLSRMLMEFHNHQGMSERIKNTPLPRYYTTYSRIFVYLHGVLVPLAFIEELGWINVPLSLAINFVFLSLDHVGAQVEDPFENRMADVPLTAISVTIERNLREMLGEETLPEKPAIRKGVQV